MWPPLAWKTTLHRLGKLWMSKRVVFCGMRSNSSNRATSMSLVLDRAWVRCWICLCRTSQTCSIGLRPFHFLDSLKVLVHDVCLRGLVLSSTRANILFLWSREMFLSYNGQWSISDHVHLREPLNKNDFPHYNRTSIRATMLSHTAVTETFILLSITLDAFHH